MESHAYKCFKCNFHSSIENEIKEHEKEEHLMDPLKNNTKAEEMKEQHSNEEDQCHYYTCTKCDKHYTT